MIKRILAMGLLLSLVTLLLADEPKPPELSPEEQKLAQQANKLNEEMLDLYRRGKPAEAMGKAREALEILQRIYRSEKFPDGHLDLANAINNFATMLQATGAYAQALPHFERSLAMKRHLYPADRYANGHPDLATTINNYAYQLQTMGAFDKALSHYEEALAMRLKFFDRKDYPDGHPDIAQSYNNMGFVLQSMGAFERAASAYRAGSAIQQQVYPRSKFPDGHADQASTFNNMALLAHAMGDYREAHTRFVQAIGIYEKVSPPAQFPDGHPTLASMYNNLGLLLEAMGDYEKARAAYEKALAMRERLYPPAKYPRGHPGLASSYASLASFLRHTGAFEPAIANYERSLATYQHLYPPETFPAGNPEIAALLHSLGLLHQDLKSHDKAKDFFEKSLAMRRTLYPEAKFPDGHPFVAFSLFSLGSVEKSANRYEEALAQFEKAHDMRRRLYPPAKFPAGHPEIANCLIEIANTLDSLRKHERAEREYEKAIEMLEALYPPARFPNGHPGLSRALSIVGRHHFTLGSPERAKPLVERALAMRRAELADFLATATETDALAFVESMSATFDGYLSLTRHVADSEADAYRAVWDAKSAISRVMERRHAAARAAGTEHAQELDRITALRRRYARLVTETRLKSEERESLLAEYSRELAELERKSAAAIPAIKSWRDREKLTPADLLGALPADAAFVDVVAYTRFDQDPKTPGLLGERRTRSYAMFVLAYGKPIRRVELGGSAEIDAAIRTWREAIEWRNDREPPDSLKALAATVAKALPGGTRTLFIAPDGDLNRLPFAALPYPGREATMLEAFRGGIAVVPHAVFLAAQLRRPASFSSASETVFGVGNLDYQAAAPALPATQAEINALRARAGTRAVTLQTGRDATAATVQRDLVHARFAHLATHGKFDATALDAERREARRSLQARLAGDEARSVAAKNPLGYVGLILAGGEVLSGLSILDLNLDNLHLVTLSACETGLGEYTGGEGVQGLQRAFHLAGCPNVVASLWKVNDAATAALMVKFYHEMWVNKKPPIEALREAQLTIYRRPDLIETLASAERGIKLEQALNAKSDRPAETKGTTPTKLWAAFVLSGVGK